jgi:hypothetical protein
LPLYCNLRKHFGQKDLQTGAAYRFMSENDVARNFHRHVEDTGIVARVGGLSWRIGA